MEIKIDTAKDSAEDIKRMIEFLQRFVDAGSGFESIAPEANEGLFNIFGDDSNQPDEPEDLSEDSEEINYSDPDIQIMPYE